MNDTVLFLVGCGAFGLMIIGIVLTVLEFRTISEQDRRRSAASRRDSRSRVSQTPRSDSHQ